MQTLFLETRSEFHYHIMFIPGNANLSLFTLCCVVRKWVTEHVTMLKEILILTNKTTFSESTHRCSFFVTN